MISTTEYKHKKERARERSATTVLAGQDIGAIPPVENPQRRARASKSLRLFCETYFPKLFYLVWSADHLRIIAKIESAVLGVGGGLSAMAMPRGSGKTTLCQVAAVWAMLCGHQQFVFLINATAEYADNALENIKHHLSQNDLLLADFPEMIYPIRCLENESRRCTGQRYYGTLTHIGWQSDQIIFPTIPGSAASGAIVRTSGLLGNVRGALYIRPDGHSVRPTLAIIDDPQTDDSARSPSQTKSRLAVVNGAILNLAGPGKKISAIMPCTVIKPRDLADQILDRGKHPEWQGERTKMVYKFPNNEDLWAKYSELRRESMRNDGDGSNATEFYKQNRAEMDKGSVVAWPVRFNDDELSAIQHAMNLRFRDEASFFAEYQNEPMPDAVEPVGITTADDITRKVNGMKRGEVPVSATHVTAFIDVQATLLYWMVAAWEDNFTGYILDYGAYPDPKLNYFTLAEAKHTLAKEHPGGQEAAIYGGLTTLTDLLLAREWKREGGAAAKIDQCLIDANWGDSTDVVYQFCRQSTHAAIIKPSHGRFVGASSIPFSEYQKRPGEKMGVHWRMPSIAGKRSIRHVVMDTNYWKSFVHSRLAVPMGGAGCLSLFSGREHRMIADQLTAEYFVEVEARGRKINEWKEKAGRPDNHLFDCAVGCAVGASMMGVTLMGIGSGEKKKRKQYTQAMLRARAS